MVKKKASIEERDKEIEKGKWKEPRK